MPNGHRHWCFTWNTPHAQMRVPNVHDARLRYICWQQEIGSGGPDGAGNEHLQGYVEFKQAMRLPAVLAALDAPGVHVEHRWKTTRDKAREYCRKDDDTTVEGTFVEFGKWISGQGSRSDIEDVVEAVREGASIVEIARGFPQVFIRSTRGVERYHALLGVDPPRRMPYVYTLWGPTGTGKSRHSVLNYPQPYRWTRPQNSTSYALGYAGERVVVLDDFYGWLPWSLLLNLLDPYKFKVNCQGYSETWLAEIIIITSNKKPQEWYNELTVGPWDPLKRRINKIIHVSVENDAGIRALVEGDGAWADLFIKNNED